MATDRFVVMQCWLKICLSITLHWFGIDRANWKTTSRANYASLAQVSLNSFIFDFIAQARLWWHISKRYPIVWLLLISTEIFRFAQAVVKCAVWGLGRILIFTIKIFHLFIFIRKKSFTSLLILIDLFLTLSISIWSFTAAQPTLVLKLEVYLKVSWAFLGPILNIVSFVAHLLGKV